MALTLASLVFLPLALWVMTSSARSVAALAATVGFSASGVVNFPGVPFGAQPYHVFGLIVIVRAVFDARASRVERRRRRITWVLYAMLLLWLTAVISFAVHPPGEADTFYLVAQLGHLSFGLAVAWSISRLVRAADMLRRVCTALERGVVFIAAWGVMEFVLRRAGAPYPKAVFNNSVGGTVQTVTHEASTIGRFDIERVGSVATEPSFVGRTLVIGLAVLLVRHAHGSLKERRWMALGALIVLFGLFASLSTTGLFGLAVLCGAGLVAGGRYNVQRATALIVTAGMTVIALYPALADALYEVTFQKELTGSFKTRRQTIEMARQVFFDHPIFGVGLGNQTSDDLPYRVLSNLGVVGAACLAVLVIGLVVGRATPQSAGTVRPELRALKLGLALSVAMDWVAGWSFYYGDLWVIVGLLLAALTVSSSAQGGDERHDERPAEPDEAPLLPEAWRPSERIPALVGGRGAPPGAG